jgi:hypothetical protein
MDFPTPNMQNFDKRIKEEWKNICVHRLEELIFLNVHTL